MSDAQSYNKLEKKDVEALVPKINPHLTATEFPADKTTILEKDLPFYDGFRILDVSNHSLTPVTRRFVLFSENEVIPIDFTNGPIYKLNGKGQLKLNRDTIIPYVMFFFEFVRGTKGHFQIIESLDDILWLDEPSSQLRRALAPKIMPMVISEVQENGTYIVDTTMIFKDCLIHVKVHVDKEGFVTMKDQKIIEANLTVKETHIGP